MAEYDDADLAAQRALGAAVEGLAAAAGLAAQVHVEGSDGEVDHRVALDGDGLEPLVGRNGEVIDAIQYLLSQVASRAGGGRRRVALNIGGYRERRAAALEDLAARAAKEAIEFGEEIELDPMTPHDRRLVHMALKAHPEVVTRSEGEEPRRRIIVEPAD